MISSEQSSMEDHWSSYISNEMVTNLSQLLKEAVKQTRGRR